MRIFDTYVQKLKYKVLTELARQTWVGNDAFSVFNDIANQVVKKGEPTMSCCIYKDRAIVAERIRIALGGKKDDHNVIQVIDIACDECPVAGHVVTDLCRGCGMRQMRQELSVQRHRQLQAAVRKGLQGGRHFHGAGRGGTDRQREVHRVRRMRV